MRDEHDRASRLLEGEDAAEALALERLVADGEDLVEEQDVGVEECCDREAEAHRHPGRVRPHRAVDRILELGEGDDLVEAAADVRAAKALDRAVQEHVLAAREVRVEASAELEEGADPAARPHGARARLDDPGDETQQGRLARSVAPDETDGLSLAHIERDVVERPDLYCLGAAALDEQILQGAHLARVDAKGPRDIADADLADVHAA